MNVHKSTEISIVLAVGLAFVSLAMHACSSEAPDTTPPAQVTDLRVEAFTETTAVLVWTAPGDDGDRGQAAEYDLRVSTAPPPSDWLSAAPADADIPHPSKPGEPDSAVVGGLTFGVTHTFALRTADDDGNWSVFSNTVEVETADSAPPARVTDLTITLPAPHAVTLVFTAPGDDSLSGTAATYEVRVSPSPITEATWVSAQPVTVSGTPLPGGSLEHVRVTGLTPGTTVHLALRARDNVSRGSGVSNDAEATLPADTVAPATITDLEVVETGTRTATLRWTAPGNDGDEAKVDGYEIRYAESRIEDEADWQVAGSVQASVSIVHPGVTQTATVSDLPGPKTLWFAVRATDLAGNRGAFSNGASGFVERPQLTWLIRADGLGDAPTVQAGIDSAAIGDTVLVMPGRYYENLNYNGKNIVVRSQAGPEVTILDGSHKRGSVVVFRNGEGRGAVIEGFTITGGVGDLMDGATGDDYRMGGGVLILYCGPTIRGNVIEKNTVGMWGGGSWRRTYRLGH